MEVVGIAFEKSNPLMKAAGTELLRKKRKIRKCMIRYSISFRP